MANKQSLPDTLLNAKVGDISSPAPNRVVAPEWKESKWSTISNIGKGIVGISGAYKNMKHTEMMAKLDNLEQQNLHLLGDAKDPCELPDLVNQANKSYDELFKDDPYGKSFYESDAYRVFKTKNEANVQKVVNSLNHKFAEIQAVATGNEIISDIALMSDPQRMSSALKAFESQLANMEITADRKFEIMSAVTKDSFGKVFANNPNNALAWYNASNGRYDMFGVNGVDIKDKADKWNKARASEQLTLQNKLRTAKKNEEDAKIEFIKQQVRLGNMTKSDAQLEADKYSTRVGNEVYKALNPKGQDNEEIEKHNSAITQLIDVGDYDKSNKAVTKYLLDNPNIPSQSRAYVNDILASIKPEKDQKDGRTLDQVKAIHDVKQGANYSDEEMRAISGDNDKVYEDLLTARETYLTNEGKKTKEISQTNKEQFKEDSKKALADKETQLYTISDNPKKIAEFIMQPYGDLTSEDYLTLRRKGIDALEKLGEQQKKEYESEIKKQQVAKTQNILNDISKGVLPSDEYLEKLSHQLTSEQVNQIRMARGAKYKEYGEEAIRTGNNAIVASAYGAWKKGSIVDVDSLVSSMKNLTPSEQSTWRDRFINGNKEVATLNENSNMAKVQTSIWSSTNPPSDEDLRKYAQDISKNGVTDEATVFENLVKMRDEKQKDVSGKKANAINLLNQYWVAEGGYADTQKVKAIRRIGEIIDSGKNVTNADVANLLEEYMPNADKIRSYSLNENSAIYEIENLQSKIFSYTTTKKEKGDSSSKFTQWQANEDLNFTDFRNYELIVQNSKDKELITQEKYQEYMQPLMSGYEKAVQNALENPDTIIGRAATRLKNKLYPQTDEYSLFDSEIKDYQDFYHHLSGIADMIEYYNIPLDSSITTGEKTLNAIKSFVGGSLEYRVDFIKTEMIVDDYLEKAFPSAKQGNVIIGG